MFFFPCPKCSGQNVAEGLRCPNCDAEGVGLTPKSDNFRERVSDSINAINGVSIPSPYASTQKEVFLPVAPIQMPTTQITCDDFYKTIPSCSSQVKMDSITFIDQLMLNNSPLSRIQESDNERHNCNVTLCDSGTVIYSDHNRRHMNVPNFPEKYKNFQDTGINKENTQSSIELPVVGLVYRSEDIDAADSFRNHLMPENIEKAKTIQVNKSKRKASNDQMILDKNETYKRSILEFSGKSSQFISTNTGQEGNSCEFEIGMGAKITELGFDSSSLASCKDDIVAIPCSSRIQYKNADIKLENEEVRFIETCLEENIHVCLICIKEYSNHIFEHEGKKLYKCCACMYRNSLKRNLRNHIKSYGSQHFFCKICGDTFKEKGFHDTDRTCKVCGEIFLCRTYLVQHCVSTCNAYCMSCQMEIDKHISKEEETPFYQCCSCSFRFQHESVLLQHINSHISERAFYCDICGIRFSQMSTMEKHKRSKH